MLRLWTKKKKNGKEPTKFRPLQAIFGKLHLTLYCRSVVVTQMEYALRSKQNNLIIDYVSDVNRGTASRNSDTEEKEDSRKQNKTAEILDESIEDYLEELKFYND